jgi:hypothetical protein
MTVAEMEDRMGQAELDRWIAYEQAEGFLATRVEIMGAVVAVTLANIHRNPKMAPADLLDFAPWLRTDLREEKVEEARRASMPEPEDEDDALLQRLVAATNG